jgi:pyruvate/2-oxoglutarate dehydrogenase complex dihydrolipoamide acyltransferase (E2) component
MTTPVHLPKPGMGTEEGTVLRWLKAEGERVRQGELIVEIEFAKATQELEAPISGRLSKILLAEGMTASVGSVIALIEETAL